MKAGSAEDQAKGPGRLLRILSRTGKDKKAKEKEGKEGKEKKEEKPKEEPKAKEKEKEAAPAPKDPPKKPVPEKPKESKPPEAEKKKDDKAAKKGDEGKKEGEGNQKNLGPPPVLKMPVPENQASVLEHPAKEVDAPGASCYVPPQPGVPDPSKPFAKTDPLLGRQLLEETGQEDVGGGTGHSKLTSSRSPPPMPPPLTTPPPAVTATKTPGKAQFAVEIDWDQPRPLGIRLSQNKAGHVLIHRLEEGSLGAEVLKTGDRVLAVDETGCVDVHHAKKAMAEFRGGWLRLWVEREGAAPSPAPRLLPRKPGPDPTILPDDVLRIAQHARHAHHRLARAPPAKSKQGILRRPAAVSNPAAVPSRSASTSEKEPAEIHIQSDLPPHVIPYLKKCNPLGVL